MNQILSFIKNMLWSLIFLLFAIFEYNFQTIDICGSGQVTGEMWFMWLCMSIAACPWLKN